MTTNIELIRGAEVATSVDEFEALLRENRALRVEYQIVPDRPFVRVGHVPALCLLARFQRAGHEIHLVIDSTTATSAGVESGEDGHSMTIDEIRSNAATCLDQVGRFIDLNRAVVRNHAGAVVADVLVGTAARLTAERSAREQVGRRLPACIVVPTLHEADMQPTGTSLTDSVGVDADPTAIAAVAASIPDGMIDAWLDLLRDLPGDAVEPCDRKVELATRLASMCRRRAGSSDAPAVHLRRPPSMMMTICPLLVAARLADSLDAACRQVASPRGVAVGAYRWVVRDPRTYIILQDNLIVRNGFGEAASLRFAD